MQVVERGAVEPRDDQDVGPLPSWLEIDDYVGRVLPRVDAGQRDLPLDPAKRGGPDDGR